MVIESLYEAKLDSVFQRITHPELSDGLSDYRLRPDEQFSAYEIYGLIAQLRRAGRLR